MPSHLPFNKNLDLRATKILFRPGTRRIEVTAAIENLLQDDAAISVVSRNFFASTFGQPATWIKPRKMYFMLRGWF